MSDDLGFMRDPGTFLRVSSRDEDRALVVVWSDNLPLDDVIRYLQMHVPMLTTLPMLTHQVGTSRGVSCVLPAEDMDDLKFAMEMFR
jgi:hypothetical protein